jgi:hypothetical protein
VHLHPKGDAAVKEAFDPVVPFANGRRRGGTLCDKHFRTLGTIDLNGAFESG